MNPATMLLSTWRSDKRRTLRDFQHYQQLPASRKKRLLARIFGKLTLRYTRKYVYTELDGRASRERYKLLASDADSVVVRTYADNRRKELRAKYGPMFDPWMLPKLMHLTFCQCRGRDYFWIGLGRYCEWFRKVNQAKPRRGAGLNGPAHSNHAARAGVP
jgi:hypothetical protein